MIKKIIEMYFKLKSEKNEKCDNYIRKLQKAIFELGDTFKDTEKFIDISYENKWQEKYGRIIEELYVMPIKKLKRAKNYHKLFTIYRNVQENTKTLRNKIQDHNANAIRIKKEYAKSLIGKIEDKMLDNQQLECIIKPTHNHLVVAGAGTGKTTTIIGKLKYLIKSNQYDPKDILLLSFTHASANEMSNRIKKELNVDFEASTFHKLGLNIMTSIMRSKPKITDISLYKFIKKELEKLIDDPKYYKLLTNYLIYSSIPSKSEFEFTTKKEYEEYLKMNPPTTIDRIDVKSYGEMDIGNFLYQNNISYVYEASYKHDTASSEFAQYKPDFYLPEYDIYIEFFGIDKNGNVPKYFEGTNHMSASERYQQSIKWKRDLHQNNNTVMIECFAYERQENTLLKNLKDNLEKHSVRFMPKNPDEIWNTISDNKGKILDGIIELFETLINLIKNNNYTFEELKEKCRHTTYSQKNLDILTLLEPIYNNYYQELQKNDEIDFNDMINIATKYVKEEKYINHYKCIIIDEYQDMSKSRYQLLKALRDSQDYELFCVGDDWQSIYRFAGSDIGYTTNFEKYWGSSEISRIETTYRFGPQLIDISSQFIMKNQSQIKKWIKGYSYEQGFPLGIIQGYTEQYATEYMLQRLKELPQNSTVYMIGRYSFDINMLKDVNKIAIQYNNISGTYIIKYSLRPDLKIEFLTAHKSKGLQADYVFILNNKCTRAGFPSNIQNAQILELLLDNNDTFPYAEERRLFYVAMTRARKKLFLITIKNQESTFVKELESVYKNEIDKEKYECPKCGGRLQIKTGKNGEFFGCTNYKYNGCKFTRSINRKNT